MTGNLRWISRHPNLKRPVPKPAFLPLLFGVFGKIFMVALRMSPGIRVIPEAQRTVRTSRGKHLKVFGCGSVSSFREAMSAATTDMHGGDIRSATMCFRLIHMQKADGEMMIS